MAKANQVIAHIVEKVEFDLPQELVNREAQRRTNEIAQRAMQNGMGNEELMAHQDEILGSATQQARQGVKVSFILEQVAQKEGLTISDQQLTYALANMASQQKKPIKKFITDAQKSGMVDRLREDLLLESALQFIKDNAQVEETDPEAEHCAEHNPAPAPAAAEDVPAKDIEVEVEKAIRRLASGAGQRRCWMLRGLAALRLCALSDGDALDVDPGNRSFLAHPWAEFW
eukprot:gene5943-7389_t